MTNDDLARAFSAHRFEETFPRARGFISPW
jgi:hypothetical protein